MRFASHGKNPVTTLDELRDSFNHVAIAKCRRRDAMSEDVGVSSGSPFAIVLKDWIKHIPFHLAPRHAKHIVSHAVELLHRVRHTRKT